MAVYLGDIGIGATLDHMFTTVDSSGGAVAMDSTCIIAVFTGNSTTPNSSGITLNASFSTIVGLNHIRIVAASTSGYSSNTDNHIVVRTGTAGSKPLAGYMIGSFSIENRVHLRPTVNGRTLDVSAGGEAGIDWANIGSPTTAVNLSATNIDVDQVLASVSGAVGSVTGAVGSVTGNVGGNVVGSVGSVAAGGIAAASFAAGAIDASAIAANAIGASEIADGAIDAATFAAGAINAAAIADGAIDAATFAANAITATVVADGFITAAKFSTGAITSSAVSANYLDAVWDEVVDGTVTARESFRLANSANGGLVAGAGTTSVTLRDLANTKNRVTAAVDASGNRSTIVLDLT